MSDNETYYYVRSTKFCFFYMHVYLFYIFIRLMLLRLCSQHYFILVMNPVTFNNNNNNKKKNWTAPGIDGIQNYWWKKFKAAQRALKREFERIRDNNKLIPVWWPSGRTILLPKMKDLSDEKKYRPITCLNTSYKLLTGLIGKYMGEHAIVNDIWDKGQVGASEEGLGTVDQLIIDRCILEEVKSYHRILAMAYYDYKKAYDKVHHDWMLRVYTWIGIPTNVKAQLRELMRKWKTRLEIWNNGENKISQWINILCGFLQGDRILLDKDTSM